MEKNDFDSERVLANMKEEELAAQEQQMLERYGAMQIQAKVRTFIAQDKLLTLWENSFYDMMALTIQTKIKSYLAQIEFDSRVLLAGDAEAR